MRYRWLAGARFRRPTPVVPKPSPVEKRVCLATGHASVLCAVGACPSCMYVHVSFVLCLVLSLSCCCCYSGRYRGTSWTLAHDAWQIQQTRSATRCVGYTKLAGCDLCTPWSLVGPVAYVRPVQGNVEEGCNAQLDTFVMLHHTLALLVICVA